MPKPSSPSPSAQGMILTPAEVAQLLSTEAGKAQVSSIWTPNKQQRKIFLRLEFEIAFLGSRYGGKTDAGIRWIIQGNPDKPNFDPITKEPRLVDTSYTYHPNFLGAVIRKNEKDLSEWVDRARPVYKSYGGDYTKAPAEFTFPSGGRIFLGHAEDKTAWEKYQGMNITRYLIEEAGQIPSLRTYELLKSSCRCPYPGMRAQLLLNANPGGSFHSTLFDRFIEPKDPKSGDLLINPHTDRPYQPEETIEEIIIHPFTLKPMKLTRVWIPSYLTDNPYAVADPTYALNLASISDEATRKAFLFGDWRAYRGSFFSMFSKERHTLPSQQLPIAPWMTAYGGLDVGYAHDAAIHWARQNPETQQICIYKGFGGAGIDAVELGAEIARNSIEELRTQPRIIVFVSHDAFHERTGDITYVDLLKQGASRILGKNSVFIPDRVLDQLKDRVQQEGRLWDPSVEAQFLEVKEKGLIFRRAPRNRVVGFVYMRDLMRVKPLIDRKAAPDWEVARRICMEDGPEAYYHYLRLFQNPDEILPKLLISQECKSLIAAIPKLVHDEVKVEEPSDAHFEGMDWLESCRYLLLGMREMPLPSEPYTLQKQRYLAQARLRDPSLTTSEMIWINRFLEEAEEEKEGEGFTPPRRSRALSRRRGYPVG